MEISVYSIVTAIIFFSITIIICEVLRRKNGFLLHYSINTLLLLIFASVFRLTIPIEMQGTIIINSEIIYPAIRDFSLSKIFIYGNELSIINLLFCIWGIGSLIYLVRLIMNILKDRQTLKRLNLSSIEHDKINICMEQVMAKSKRKARLIVSSQIDMPMLAGLFTPTILLPKMIISLSDEAVKYILTHEWYHFLNRDLWIKGLIELLCCMMWWNPVVYLLKRNLDQALEIRCDLRVTQKMDSKQKGNYLKTILLISGNHIAAEYKQSYSPIVSTFIGDNDFSIIQRFQLISKYKSKHWAQYIICSMTIILLFGISYGFAIHPFYSEGPPIEDLVGVIDINPENSHILVKRDGTYVMVNVQLPLHVIPKKKISQLPYKLLPKIYE